MYYDDCTNKQSLSLKIKGKRHGLNKLAWKFKCWIFNRLGHMIPLWKGKNPIYFGVITIMPFDNLYRRAYFVMHTFLVFIHLRGNHVVKFSKDPIYRTKVIMPKRPLSKILFIVSDLDLWPNDPKINMVLSLPRTLYILGSLGQGHRYYKYNF
jgi:hypothetical protein